MTEAKVSAYMAAEGVSLRDTFLSTTHSGDLEWDDSGVTEAYVSAFMTAEGVSLRNEFCCTTFRGYVNRDDSGFLAQTNDELTSCEAFCSVSRRSELE